MGLNLFNMREFLTGSDVKTMKEFNRIREELENKNAMYKFYFKSMYSTGKILIELFINFNDDILYLIECLNKEKTSEIREKVLEELKTEISKIIKEGLKVNNDD